MEQQKHSFSYSTQRAGSDRLQKSAKTCLMPLQLMSINSQITNYHPKVRVRSFRPFLNRKKIRPIGGRIRNHSENVEIIFLFISKKIKSHFFFRFYN